MKMRFFRISELTAKGISVSVYALNNAYCHKLKITTTHQDILISTYSKLFNPELEFSLNLTQFADALLEKGYSETGEFEYNDFVEFCEKSVTL